MAEQKAFYFGDSDLILLGAIAALAARYQMRRKGGSVPLPGFPKDDQHAVDMVQTGIALGRSLPLDDVPNIELAAWADEGVVPAVQDLIYRIVSGDADEEVDRG